MRRFEFQFETLSAAGAAFGIAACSCPRLLFVLLLLPLLRKYRGVFLLSMALGALSQFLHAPGSGAPERFWPSHDQRITLQFQLLDTRLGLSGEQDPSLLRLRAKALSPCRGGIELLFPASEEPPHFGELCTAQGILKKLESGKCRVFYAERLLSAKPGPWTIWHLPLWLRDKLLSRLLHGVRSDAVRQLAPRLFFGAGNGPDREQKQIFIRSGTIHLFSVSGMHVGVLAALVLLFLRPLPLKLRYRVLAGAVVLYVLATGANAPALRAGFMVVLWSFLHSCCLGIPPLRAMMLAATFLLLLDPQALFQVGFQYSFVITAVLLLAAKKMQDVRRVLEIPHALMPWGDPAGKAAGQRFRRNFRLAGALLLCGAAFLAGAGISVCRQDQLLPGSAATNFLLLPVTALLFAAAGFKLLPGLLHPELDAMGARLLELAFQLLQQTAELGRHCFSNFDAIRPPGSEAVLYTLLLCAALGSRRLRQSAVCGGAALLLLFSWPLRSSCGVPEVAVISGAANQPPAVVISEPGMRTAQIVHVPDRLAAQTIADWLRRRGFHQAECYSSTRKNAALRGLSALASKIDIPRLFLPAPQGNDTVFRENLRCALPDTLLVRQRENPVPLKISEKNQTLHLEYFNPGSTLSFDMKIAPGDEGQLVTLHHNGAEYRHLSVWNNTQEIWSHEFR